TIASIINDSGQCLVFVSSRKKAEELASKISVFLQDRLGGTGPEMNLEDDPYAEKISNCLAGRTCFHHAGLSNPVRSSIESYFKKGELLVIVATPTLAAGVNLPARCVIIRDITRYQNGRSEYLPAREIFQMIGRAGRPKYDKEGYAYLYAASSNSFTKAMEYFTMEIEP
ncbi:protein containing DNA/RNA helicase, partial [mine drainage metagenome]